MSKIMSSIKKPLFKHVIYNEERHTTEALGRQLETICQANESLYIAGSLGRAAIYEAKGLGYAREYEARREEITYKNDGSVAVARDVDIVVPEYHEVNDANVFPVDTIFCSGIGRFILENDDWWLVSDRHNFQEQINEDLMEPQPAKLGDYSYTTLLPATQYALCDIQGSTERGKKIGFVTKLLRDTLSSQELKQYEDNAAPFIRLGNLNEGDFLLKIRRFYQASVPLNTRMKLSFISGLVSKNIIDR